MIFCICLQQLEKMGGRVTSGLSHTAYSLQLHGDILAETNVLYSKFYLWSPILPIRYSAHLHTCTYLVTEIWMSVFRLTFLT